MDSRLVSLEQDLASVRETMAAASGMAVLSDAGLVGVTDALGRLVRNAQALLASAAGEVAKRSSVEAGRHGLAKKQGFQSPTRMVAAATGGGVAAASRMVKVGQASARRWSLGGDELPPAHPHVAAALAAGGISVETASAITSMLDRAAVRADPDAADQTECVLVRRAAELPYEQMVKIIAQAEARLDENGLESREEQLRAERYLRIKEDADGRVKLTATLDSESGAVVKAAVESLVTNMIRARDGVAGEADARLRAGVPRVAGVAGAAGHDRGGGSGGAGDVAAAVLDDRRTIGQLQADALAMIARHVLGCARMPSAPAMAVVVRTELSTLTEGTGFAEIDGADQPVSAGAARRLAAAAELIPVVFDGESLPLDLGRDARLFTRAQRLALYERDGGCACCGLDAAYVEAHHIRWWQRDAGPTDLDNGVLLCPPCHTRIHSDGWRITVQDRRVWFTPPAHVDAAHRPRLGGKARFSLTDRAAA